MCKTILTLCCRTLPLLGLLAPIGLHGQIFTRITSGPVVTTPGDSRSVNWVDVNGDGWLDLQITNGLYPGQNNFLYLNNGAGDFVQITGDTIALDNQPSDGASWADVDNDGDLDCMVTNWYGRDNLYYENDGSGNFTRNSFHPFTDEGGYSETAAWGDYDLDGHVDLLVTNSAGTRQNFLHHNNGDGTFTKVTTGAVATDAFKSRCVTWTDADNDGDPDLFITNEDGEGENFYRNDGGGTFEKLTTGDLLSAGGNTMTASWGDIDNDGDFDVFLGNDGSPNMVYRNYGGFVFMPLVTDEVATTPGSHTFGSAWGDVDNDGDLDLYHTNSYVGSTGVQSRLFLNDGSGHFTLTGAAEPMAADSGWAYGCAFGDYDNDGFLDLAVATAALPSGDQPDWLYHNNGNANHWLKVKLTGVMANRSAIGAVVHVKATIGGEGVWQVREVSTQTGLAGQNDLTLHFGLGDALMADSMVIQWPSHTLEFHTGIIADQQVDMTEGIRVGSSQQGELSTQRMMVFPNPASGAFGVMTDGEGLLPGDRLVITDLLGRQVWHEEMGMGASSVQVDTGLPAGTYQITWIRGEIQIGSARLVMLGK